MPISPEFIVKKERFCPECEARFELRADRYNMTFLMARSKQLFEFWDHLWDEHANKGRET